MRSHKGTEVRFPLDPDLSVPVAPHLMGAGDSGELSHPESISTPSLGGQSPDDSRVIAALEAYLEALRAGRPLSRGEFLARHAEIADALVQCLSGLEFIQTAAVQLVGSDAGRPALPAEPVLPRAQLGDYRVIREIGRGGMGVVYEAEQISLGRRVALKVLPFAAAIDPKQRQRFQIEAQAAAQLHHPHIVPIFNVGCDGGIHYYTMQFVEGRSLAAIVHELRSSDDAHADVKLHSLSVSSVETEEAPPTPRESQGGGPAPSFAYVPGAREPIADSHCDTVSEREAGPADGGFFLAPTTVGPVHQDRAFCCNVARLGADAADALDHAHGLGILHRDIKPANLLIDHHGAVWITDFGLARVHSDLSLTGTGDVVGTLRYMSPEQALAQRGVVDQRTDVYALGVTLYELLTLRPAFDGRDHQELLRQIALEEPARPRRLNPAIPRDLETIVLKAMAKDLSSRYATAQELAADLGRFLDDQPIVARRPGLVECTLRRARRHWKQVATAALIIVTSLIIGTVVTLTEARKTEDAYAKVRAASREEHDYISETFPLIDMLILDAMSQATRLAQGGSDPTDRETMLEVYKRAEGFYRRAANLTLANTDDADSRTIVARAHYRLGFTRACMGGAKGMTPSSDPQLRAKAARESQRILAQAESDYQKSIDLFETLLAKSPRDQKVRRHYANALSSWGWAWYLDFTGRKTIAEPHYRRAIQLWHEVVRDTGDENQGGASAHQDVAAEPNDLIALTDAVLALSQILDDTGRSPEADELCRNLEDDATFVSTRFSGLAHEGLRRTWAHRLAMSGAMSLRADKRRMAAMEYRLSMMLDPEGKQAYNNLAWMLASLPGDPWFDPKRALGLAQKAVVLDSTNWMHWNTLGVAAFRVRDWQKADEALKKAVELDASGGSAFNWFFQAMTRWQQGKPEEARRLFDQAVAWMKEKKSDDPELRRFHAEAADLLGLHRSEPSRRTPQTNPPRVKTPKKPVMTCPDQDFLFCYPFISLLGS